MSKNIINRTLCPSNDCCKLSIQFEKNHAVFLYPISLIYGVTWNSTKDNEFLYYFQKNVENKLVKFFVKNCYVRRKYGRNIIVGSNTLYQNVILAYSFTDAQCYRSAFDIIEDNMENLKPKWRKYPLPEAVGPVLYDKTSYEEKKISPPKSSSLINDKVGLVSYDKTLYKERQISPRSSSPLDDKLLNKKKYNQNRCRQT